MARRFNLRARLEELLAENNGVCTKKRPCAFLAVAIEVTGDKPTGIAVEQGFSVKTGRQTEPQVMLWLPGRHPMAFAHCPFCGERLNRKTKKAARVEKKVPA